MRPCFRAPHRGRVAVSTLSGTNPLPCGEANIECWRAEQSVIADPVSGAGEARGDAAEASAREAEPAIELRADERPWFVYLLSCRGGRIYTGVTPDLVARMRKHRAGTGAKFTRAHPPESLLAAKRFASRGAALSMEHQMKQLPALEKRTLARTWCEEEGAVDLSEVVPVLA